jgi:CDP-diacylglycerol---glycerol-3-phosphate 3-phosphatidyltransferase
MNLPNKLTIARLVMTVVFVGCMAAGEEYALSDGSVFKAPGREHGWSFAYTVALVLFVVAGITDYFDGSIARKRGLVTNFGKLMDPLADKVLMAAGFICLVPLKALPAWVVICIISREFLITGLRLVAASKGQILPSEKLGKHKTLWQIITVGYFLLLLSVVEFARAGAPLHVDLWWWYAWRWLGWTLGGVALALTLYSGLGYLSRHRDLLSE